MSHPVVKWQILSRDPDRTARFYGELFDWTIDADNPLGYRMVDTGSREGIQGGIWPAPPEGHDFVQLFVRVDDVGSHIAKARELGASIVVPPQTLPDGDRMAVIVDPQGVPLGLYQPA
jgi:hypothetical protein